MSGTLPFDPEIVAVAAKTNHEFEPVKLVNGHDIADLVLPPEFADDALGLRFSYQFSPALRFVAAWNRWMLWDGAIWKKDDTLRVYDLVRRSCRAISGEARDPKTRAALSSAKTIAAVEKLVRSDRRHASTADQWELGPVVAEHTRWRGELTDRRKTSARSHIPYDQSDRR